MGQADLEKLWKLSQEVETCCEEASPLRHAGCRGEKLGSFANLDELSLPYASSPP